jgi:hypothetical protein
MSHKHRDTDSIHVVPAEPVHAVNTQQLDKVLDTTVLDAVLDFCMTEPGMMEYVAETIKLGRASLQCNKLLQKMAASHGKLEDFNILESRLMAMWSFGFIAGASCAVKAVDEGLIVDSSESDDDEGGYYDGSD